MTSHVFRNSLIFVLFGFLFLLCVEACSNNNGPVAVVRTPPKPDELTKPNEHPASSDNKPFVSVAVATYEKRQGYHKILYEAFKNQDYDGKLELIVYDNAAKPSSFFTTLSDQEKTVLATTNKTVKYLHTTQTPDELTLGAKRNELVEKASGDIIVVWDDDDFYGKNYVSFMVEQMQTQKADFIKSTQWIMAHFDKTGQTITYDLVNPSLARDYGWGFAFAFKKNVYGNCRYENRNYMEEDSFAQCVDTHDAGYKFVRLEFDSLNNKPLMVKFDSDVPKKFAANWTSKYHELYKTNSFSRKPLQSYTKDQITNIDKSQSDLLEQYIKLYYDLGK